jgi:hypothetical protein
MQLKFDKTSGLLIYFAPNELKFAVAMLKGINQVVKMSFIQECIDDIEIHLQPKKQLPFINYFHLCRSCFRTIDERDENTMCLTKDGDTKWKCRVCKPLNPHRPR